MNEQEQVTQGYIPRFGHTTKVPYFLVEEPTKSRVTLSNPNPPSRGPQRIPRFHFNKSSKSGWYKLPGAHHKYWVLRGQPLAV